MRIPTILGLFILIIALGAGIFYANLLQRSAPSPDIAPPQGIQVVGVSSNEATIIWQTQKDSTGFISFGESSQLGQAQNDIRDTDRPKPHKAHFVTLKNLKQNTTYYFKVRSGPYFYPDNPQTFKTATLPDPDTLKKAEEFNKPVIGVISDSKLQPIDEAVVLLKVAGTETLAALTSPVGNFILSTVNLYDSSLKENLVLSQKTTADLEVIKDSSITDVRITIPSDNPLPKIILGQNSDFTQIASASAKPSASPSPSKTSNPYDLNSDGRVNSIDLTIVLENMGRSAKDPNFNKAADLNNDGVVDQQDVDLMKKFLSQ